MSVEEAYRLISRALPYSEGAFYGSAHGIAIGAGLLYNGVKYPLFDTALTRYRTVRGPVYVVTHECDVEQENTRPFNDSVLVCPIISLEYFVEEWQGMPNFPGFLGDLARRRVTRTVFIPAVGVLAYGGILYLNRIISTHVSVFGDAEVGTIGAVSATGLREVDAAIGNLLFREKSDYLWGMRR